MNQKRSFVYLTTLFLEKHRDREVYFVLHSATESYMLILET